MGLVNTPQNQEVMDYNLKNDISERLEELEDVTDLDLEDTFDNIEYEPNLPRGAPAATKHSEKPNYFYGINNEETDLLLGTDFFNLSDYEQDHVLLHEGIHGLDFNDELKTELQKQGLSNNSLMKINELLNSSELEMEGTVEYLTHLFDPYSELVGNKFRPREMQAVEGELNNVQSELSKEIGSFTKEVLNEFREVYDFEVGENYLFEHGEFNGQEYKMFVNPSGFVEENGFDEYAAEIASYIDTDEVYGLCEDPGYQGEELKSNPGSIAPNNSINWQGYSDKLNL